MNHVTDNTLWERLRRTPNDHELLTLWVKQREAAGGDQGALQALREAAALSGSWLAKIWSTREMLAKGDLKSALEIYCVVLKGTDNDSLAMQEMSGHLGEAGYYHEAIEWLLPVYSPHRHGLFAGLNLLNCCQDAQDFDSGLDLVHRMRGVHWPGFEVVLEKYEFIFLGRSRDRRWSQHLSN